MKDNIQLADFTLANRVLFEKLVDAIYQVDNTCSVYLKGEYEVERDRHVETMRMGLHDIEAALREVHWHG
jgi:hypothetical protein